MDLGSPISSVIPSLDGRVLQCLARSHRPLTGAAVARLCQGSQGGTYRVLQRLVAHGLVDSERQGASVLYLGNREHAAWPAIEVLADLRARVLGLLREQLESWSEEAPSVLLFGSFARADGDEGSDIDILVVHDDTGPTEGLRDRVDQLATTVERLTGNDAQMVLMSLSELRQRAEVSDDLVSDLRQDALLLHGRSLADLGVVREALR